MKRFCDCRGEMVHSLGACIGCNDQPDPIEPVPLASLPPPSVEQVVAFARRHAERPDLSRSMARMIIVALAKKLERLSAN
jgi:hypothetical protein